MKKFRAVILIMILLCLVSLSLVASVNAEEYNMRSRMESGDLSLEQAYEALQNGEFEKVEKIATSRAAEDLYLLASMQEIQFKCKEAKETYNKVLLLNPDHKQAAEYLQGKGLCALIESQERNKH